MEPQWDVIVVGAGLAGLCAAASATQHGARVLVLESHQAGGRARTVERQGFVLNMGAHALFVRGAGASVLGELGVTPRGTPPPLSHYRALAGGTQHVLPSGPATLLRTRVLGVRAKGQLTLFFTRLGRARPERLAGVTMAEWLGGFDLRPEAASVVRALVRLSTYSDDVEACSADAGVSQLQVASRGGVLYLHGGWGPLVAELGAGLTVRTGVEVRGLEPGAQGADGVAVHTADGPITARHVVVSTGGPAAVRRLLPSRPDWGDLGGPVTAACLDVGVRGVPGPGYVLSLDDPVYVTLQSPPGRQAPDGSAVVAAIRYGSRTAAEDRGQLEALLAEAGVADDRIVTRRFLASMTVAGTLPRVAAGGLAGRPAVTATGMPAVTMAGDWVGPVGLLADAALASGRAAGREAARRAVGSSKMVP